MEVRSGTVLARGLWKAATVRANVGISGAAAAGALLLQSGSLAALAVAGYLVTFVANLARARFWRNVVQELRSTPPTLPAAACLSDSVARELLGRLEDARSERAQVMEGASRTTRTRAALLAEAVVDLENVAVRLVNLVDRLGRYLTGRDPSGLLAQINRSEALAATACTPPIRRQYHEVRGALIERHRSLCEVQAWRDLVVARLEAIVCTLEALPPRLMQLSGRDGELDDLAEQTSFDALGAELHTLEQAAASANQLLGQPRPALA